MIRTLEPILWPIESDLIFVTAYKIRHNPKSMFLFFHDSDDTWLEMLHQMLKKKKCEDLQTSAINFTDNTGL